MVQNGLGAKFSTTILFVIAMTIRFLVNRAFVFKSDRSTSSGLALEAGTSLMAYALNIAILMLFVDHMGFRPEYVALGALVFISILLYFVNSLLIHKTN